MPFKRGKPRAIKDAIANFFWPQIGWLRFATYIKKRIIRLADTPHRIALGLAFGIAASFNPFVGTHILQSLILCTIFRANYIAAAIGTIIGNPLTFPFFWWAAIWLGNIILTLMGFENALDAKLIALDTIKSLVEDPGSVFLPWVIGGYVIGAALIPVSYMLFKPIVTIAKAARTQIRSLQKEARS